MKNLILVVLILTANCATAQNSSRLPSGLKLFRFGDAANEKPGVLMPDGKRLNVVAFGEDYNQNFFATNGLVRLERWLNKNAAKCPLVPSGVRIAPCVANPSKIVAIG
ncbi:MAG TPA: hypothetical protein PLR06_05720, partial [Cyclobacteriaceae bacterium]|nr:hypothetical protein [Cyclobacteriaceae bacterium]